MSPAWPPGEVALIVTVGGDPAATSHEIRCQLREAFELAIRPAVVARDE